MIPMMNKSFIKKLRDYCPEFIKVMMSSILRKRFFNNKHFVSTYHDLILREQKTDIEIEKIQFLKLKNILIYSQENVPYYTKLFKDCGFNPHMFSDFKEIEKIPFLTKDLINENFNELKSTCKIKGGVYMGMTGGTTGTPLLVLLDYYSSFKENAFSYFQRRKLGLDFNSRVVTFRGLEFKNKFVISIPYRNEFIFSPFKLSNSTIFKYVNDINKLKPKFLKGYLSTIYFLAKLMDENSLNFDFNLDGIFFISENIVDSKREFIEFFFNVKSSTFYGHSERVIFGDEISNGIYKFDPYYGYTEYKYIIDNDYEIVGTGFLNYSMPLIRYRTNDICSKEKKGFNIKGRWNVDDVLLGKHGEVVSNAMYNFHNRAFKNILTQQFKQVSDGKVILYLTVNNIFSAIEILLIKKVLNSKFSNIIDFEIEVIKKPILSKNGKFNSILK